MKMKKLLLVLITMLVSLSIYAQIDFKGVYIGYKQEEIVKRVQINNYPYTIFSFNTKAGYCAGLICYPASFDVNSTDPRFIGEKEFSLLAQAISDSYQVKLEFVKAEMRYLGSKDNVMYSLMIVDMKEGYSSEDYLYSVELVISNMELHEKWLEENPQYDSRKKTKIN